MPTLFNPAERDRMLVRIGRLAPGRRPLWGRFTASEMVCHVSSALRYGLGELEAGPPKGPLSHPPLNWLVIHVLPWPRGKAKSPRAFLSVRPTSWDADLAQLAESARRFSARGPSAGWPVSPVFGRISGRSWGVLQYRHLDHHLRQFGV